MKKTRMSGTAGILSCAVALVLAAAPAAFARGGNVESPGGVDHHLQGPAINGALTATYLPGGVDDLGFPLPDSISIEITGTCGKETVTLSGNTDSTDWVDTQAQFEAATRDELNGLLLGEVPAACGFPATADTVVIINARRVTHTTDADGNPVIDADVIMLSTVPK